MLAMITSITPSLELIEPLMEALLSILQNAAVSLVQRDLSRPLMIIVLEDENTQHAGTKLGLLPQSLIDFRDLQSQMS
jgi:hypothetical protein